MLALFASATLAQSADTIANITSPVKNYTVVPAGTTTSGKIVVNVNGSESDSPYTVAGTLNVNAGGDVFADNWNGSDIIDSNADAITVNVNSGTIQTAILGQQTKGTKIYGNVVQSINGGTLGYGTQTTADCNIIRGFGTYGATDNPVVIYGNNTLNIGSKDSNAAQPTIYGYITSQQGAIVKGNTYINIMGGAITKYTGTYTNVFAGPSYKGIVEGSVYVNMSGGRVDSHIHGGGVAGANAGKILGSTNITISGGTIAGSVFGGYSGAGGSANGVNITLIGDGNNINIGGDICGGSRNTTDVSLLGTKTLYIGNSEQSFVGAEGQTFSAKQFDNIIVSSGSSIVFRNLEIYNDTIITLEQPSVALFATTDSQQLSINNLTVVFEDRYFTEGDILTADDVASLGVVLSAMPEGKSITLISVNSQTKEETLSYATVGGNSIEVNVVVPEPAEWAMIFGALALGLALYRKRKFFYIFYMTGTDRRLP